MWPGSDLPVGPPSHQPPPKAPEPPPIRPGAGWYAVPMVLGAIAVVIVVATFAFSWDGTTIADGPRGSGDSREGIELELSGGHDYFIFVREGARRPSACTLAYPPRTSEVEVPLSVKEPFATTPPSGYRHGATFTAPRTGSVRLTCDDTDGRMHVWPDDTIYGYIAMWFIAAMAIGGVAIVTLVVLLVLRVSSAKRRRAAMAAPSGFHGY